MICPQCKERNPVGNRFCRDCGARLSAPEGSLEAEEARRIEEERRFERTAELLTRAHAFLEKKRIDDAIPIAEEAATLLPTSTAAHALLATLYEQADRNADAIRAMEAVVALNPDSTVDQDKLDRLRRGVHLMPRRIVAANEPAHPAAFWAPRVAAGIVAALVLGGGFALVNRPITRPIVPTRPVSDGLLSRRSGYSPANPTLSGGSKPSIAPPSPGYDPFAGQIAPPVASTPAPPLSASLGPETARSTSPAPSGPTLPRPGTTGSEPAGTVPPVPVTLSAQPLGGVQSPAVSGNGFGEGERIKVGPPSGGETPENSGETPENGVGTGEGYIRIRVNPPPASPRNQNPVPSSAPDNGSALLRAQSLQSAGRYREAIAAYRDALASGANPGLIQQSIALCHQRLGEDGAARSAYQLALAAFEGQVRSGQQAVAAQRGITACRAALEVLGG
jgi:tetratricopeptide (TPR) repeat protein